MKAFDLTGKSAVVTGAGGGIGRGICLKLAESGAQVLVNDIHEENAQETVRLVRDAGGTAEMQLADITQSSEANALMAKSVELFGSVDILVNNAGIIRDRLIHKMSDEDWDIVLNLNLRAPFFCARAAVPVMIERRKGRIVNIASMSYLGNVGQVNYSSSKAGLVGMTLALGLELAPKGITVNCIAPGLINTPPVQTLGAVTLERIAKGVPVRTIGEPGDIAAAVHYFVSDEARYVTRQVLHVSGGGEGF